MTRKGFLAQQAAYPELVKLWRENSRRVSKGLPKLPTPSLESLRARPKGGGLEVQRGNQADPPVEG